MLYICTYDGFGVIILKGMGYLKEGVTHASVNNNINVGFSSYENSHS